jgi:hypothetical protein
MTRERPILFGGPMVRAILDGRKTQTRRLSAPWRWPQHDDDRAYAVDRCQYGRVGDRLWVREAIVCTSRSGDDIATANYAADGALCPLDRWPWQRGRLPGIHMPYGLRRITLEIANVRVQRLQEISEEDARAEGVIPGALGGHYAAFSCLWDDVNGRRAAWASNPWVWAITFKRLA